ASAAAKRIQHEGKDVTGVRWTDEGLIQYTVDGQQFQFNPASPDGVRMKVEGAPAAAAPGGRGGGRGGRGGGGSAAGTPSPDGKWIARTIDKPQPKEEPKYASEFEKRHQERFKGVIFDWKDFQRDGQ